MLTDEMLTDEMLTIAFDVLDYVPEEQQDVLEDISSSLSMIGLPSLDDERWLKEEGFFELRGSREEVHLIKDVLRQFAARVDVTPRRETIEGEDENGNGTRDEISRRDQGVGRGAWRPTGRGEGNRTAPN